MSLPNLLKSSVLLAFLSTSIANDTFSGIEPQVESLNAEDVVSVFQEQDHASTVTDNFHRLMNPFLEWKERHGKVYASVEHEIERMLVWMKHDELIEQHNQKQDPVPSYTLAHNLFSDMPNSEFREMHSLGEHAPDFEPLLEARSARMQKLLHSSLLRGGYSDNDQEIILKERVNWVEDGAVTPVLNQSACGACWAFSTTGSIEGANFVENGKLVSLSEQHLMDCDKKLDKGCKGGLMENAYTFDENGEGLCSEEDYPYEAGSYTCRSHECTTVPGSVVKSYVDIREKDMNGLLASIAISPTSIAMQANQINFQLYSGGVYDNVECGESGVIDHGVLAVGYGHDEALDQDYIMVKNSWGSKWGEQGFFKLSRTSDNAWGTCSILKVMTRPTVETIDNAPEGAIYTMVE